MNGSPIQPRTAVVTIYGGDYLDRIRHLERQAVVLEDAIEDAKKAEAETKEPRTSDEIADSVRLTEKHDRIVDERDAVRDEAEESALHVRVQALGRREWKALIAAHPPQTVKDDNVTAAKERSDVLSGVNDDTFKDALVAASVIEPEGITPEDLDVLADVDFDRIYLTAFSLNRGTSPDPKASLVSRLTQTSDETSS
jgi:hypothetical protein